MTGASVDELLTRANITLSDEDRARLARLQSEVRRQVAELRIAEARYAEPAVIFSASRSVS